MRKEFMKLVVEVFDKHCDSSLSTLMYYLLDHTVENIRGLEMLYVLHSSL